ncbi:SUN domain-containing protein 3 isoform X3 [Hydra vulgaris]|uniref:SUN domain-containing protein 3 isoform X3 n=1 Tax=Hydra vulgaris TaxID=6087 RepID=A0ABM4CCH5_HYDVU
MMGTLEERALPLRRCRSPTRVARKRLQNGISEPELHDPLETKKSANQNDIPAHLYGLDKSEDNVLDHKKDFQIATNVLKLEDTNVVGCKKSNKLLQRSWLKTILIIFCIGVVFVAFWFGAKNNYDDQTNNDVLSSLQFQQPEAVTIEELNKKIAALELNYTLVESLKQYSNLQKQTIDKLQQQISTTVNVVKSLSEKLNLLQKEAEDDKKKVEMDQKRNENGLCQGDECRYSSQNIYAVTQSFLEVYSADKLGIPDFALESAGGSIHMPHHSETCESGSPIIKVFGLPLWNDPRSPRSIINSDSLPGSCWPMKSSKGYVVIKLATMIKPTMVSLEHLDQRLDQYSYKTFKSAPKEFEVFAWFDAQGASKAKIGSYTYLRNSSAIQSFKLEKEVDNVLYIELRILTNYGNEDCTCIYRFRVHGISNDWMSGSL